MEIRQLTPQERLEANLISTIAFHFRVEDLEKEREKSLKETDENWGAFDADGRMMARIINTRYESWLDGKLIRNGGIGGVSTLPEYRESGAIRAIFSRLLPAARANGEIVSTLYPFNHAFYRKFGYETVCFENLYCFAPEVLRDYRFGGQAVQWRPGEAIDGYLQLYERFSKECNLMMKRSEQGFRQMHFEGKYYQDRKFAYLLSAHGKPIAYVIFQDVRHDPAAILRVTDLAWDGRDGFLSILGFLGRFTADYGSVELPLPSGIDLYSVIHSPKAYDIEKKPHQHYMIRVVNTAKLLETIRKPTGCRFVVRVTGDGQIQENNGCFAVGEDVRATDESPDLSVDIRALGQLACGAVSLREAAYREDVEICGNADVLEGVFQRKNLFVEDHF